MKKIVKLLTKCKSYERFFDGALAFKKYVATHFNIFLQGGGLHVVAY